MTRTGLSWVWTLGLAALAAPRAVAHDLGAVGGLGNVLLVFVPPVVWIAVVLVCRVTTPLRALTAVGAVYGLMLAVVHQALWHRAFSGDAPELGGALAGALSPVVEAVVLRGFSVVSSLVTGIGVGVICGVVAWLIRRVSPVRVDDPAP